MSLVLNKVSLPKLTSTGPETFKHLDSILLNILNNLNGKSRIELATRNTPACCLVQLYFLLLSKIKVY